MVIFKKEGDFKLNVMKKKFLLAAVAALGFFACDMSEKVNEQSSAKENV
jgi:hypothetical protein